MSFQRRMAAIAVGLLVVGGSVAMAQPASAESCQAYSNTPSLTSTKKIRFSATSYCTWSGSDLRAFLFHYFAAPLPDVQVAYATDATGPSFYAYGEVCDGGGTETYYTRSLQFGADSTSWDAVNSPNVTLNHC